MRAQYIFILFIGWLVTACTILAPATRPVPTTPPITTPRVTAAPKTPIVQIIAPTVSDIRAGEQITATLKFEPMYLERGKTASGATYTSLTPWENANIVQMRVCMEINKECAPNAAWVNFVNEWQLQFEADWLGERTYVIGAQFRDANGNLIRAYNPSVAPDQNEFGTTRLTFNSRADERTPMAAQPVFVQTAVAATRIAYPVTGAVILQNGLCCAGGQVGATIEIHAAFEASSPNSTVTQMRLLEHCGTQAEINTAAWEPFVKQKTFSYSILVPNWVGWSLAVQYRDANGNLSPIYCDDLSIEGMP